MILSFHPCVVADKNILCAGRDPDSTDLGLIKQADAVILPQGCRKTLYEMAKKNCPNVFPNYDARFAFPGKIGQTDLFKKFDVPFPKTKVFWSMKEFYEYAPSKEKLTGFDYPLVFKFDWGGESDNVFSINTQDQLSKALKQAAEFEKTGQFGFLIQEFIPTANRSLRVVVIGQKQISYWRVQPDEKNFSTGISKGAIIDAESDQNLQQSGKDMVRDFCTQTGINLAGFDLMFPEYAKQWNPLFLEINYFFGRSGLGGSEKFYELLNTEIIKWRDLIKTAT
jgi:ribosomal protein S6--L-glutamate ligase